MTMKKPELIKILVDEYGYEKEDLKFDAEGKPYTNAKLKAIIDAEIADAKEAEVNQTRFKVKEGSLLKEHDLVKVMSGSTGGVIYRSDISRRVWKFTQFGQMDSMPYGELVAMKNRYPKYFQYGWLIVLDQAVQEEFGLTNMYKNILTPENVEEVFEKSIPDLEVLVNNLPEGMKNTFINTAQRLYNEEKLYDSRIERMIEKKFKFSLRDNGPIEEYTIKSDAGKDGIIYVDKK